ncbi:hypothetical protein E4U24_000730 [Claviceps purpurea]|nr:hypothetical protein E4U11_005626 [Claviceps purpurea]KAG6167022.1 hypothetical protein E4U51_003147 [Claviceps purpurea]KAG6183285.1 hypothetical protein E4U27_001437 [Claviceps purpurea]KAG6212995.1 hypothetical protein E4U34_006922 [Claviceps purpurea]KAG6252179.1 hypothetical protein E4U24_000730 [Claviceps purpurea]
MRGTTWTGKLGKLRDDASTRTTAPLYDDPRGIGWQSVHSHLEFLCNTRAALHPYLGTGLKQGQLDPSPAAFREAGGGRRAAGSQQPYDLVDAPVTWTTAVPMSGHWALGREVGSSKGGPARAPQKVCAAVGDGRPRRTRLSSPVHLAWSSTARKGIGNGRTRRGNAGRDDG